MIALVLKPQHIFDTAFNTNTAYLINLKSHGETLEAYPLLHRPTRCNSNPRPRRLQQQLQIQRRGLSAAG